MYYRCFWISSPPPTASTNTNVSGALHGPLSSHFSDVLLLLYNMYVYVRCKGQRVRPSPHHSVVESVRLAGEYLEKTHKDVKERGNCTEK